MKAAIATVGVVGMLANGAAANPTYSSLAVKDPFCAGLQTKACKDTPNCHWTSERHVHHSHDYDYDYDNWMKVSHSAKDRTSYGKNWRPEGCSLAHVFDRMEPNVNGAEKAKLNEWGLASTWDTIECGDAFIVKDCKDINQKHPNKCEWNCHSHTSSRSPSKDLRRRRFPSKWRRLTFLAAAAGQGRRSTWRGSCPLAVVSLAFMLKKTHIRLELKLKYAFLLISNSGSK